jgi:purine-nucleoside phosphorylase
MPTPHIEAKKQDIAKIVLMPGDPLRAKLFAKKYLKKVKKINNVRGMLGFTGFYKNKKVTVMGHGMGLDSIGIYAFELFKFYDVDKIIRFGSCGTYNKELDILDIVIAKKAFTESNYGLGFGVKNKIVDATVNSSM